MFYRIFAQKDTFITNFKLRNVQQTGSNFGSSEILHLYKQAGTSGSVGVSATSSVARILTKFDLGIFSALTASYDIPSTGVSYFLKLSDAQHDKTLPSSFDVQVQAVSQDWDEGRGRDVDNFSDKGVANWVKAKSNSFWPQAGASGTGPFATAHFDNGHENIELNVTSIVQGWFSGTFSNNGFLIKISSSQEVDSQDYYAKMFHGRETSFKDKRPYLEARWNDSSRDDRNNFYFDVSGTLFLNHVVQGQFTNIPEIGTGNIGVRIVDASGTVASLTGTYTGFPGRYSVTFALPSGNFSGSLFKDIWYDFSSPSHWFMTGTFGIGDDLNVPGAQPKKYFVTVMNLRDSYETDETVRLGLFVRPHDYNPARVLTASFEANGTIVNKAYYRIVNDRTDEIVVPFSTGSLEYTRLSYDQRGNYLKLHVGSLSPGNVYRLSFLFDVDGQKQYVDQGFKFRVV